MNYYPPYGLQLSSSSVPHSYNIPRTTSDPPPLSELAPLPTHAMTAPEGIYPLHKQINIDTGAYVGCTPTDRDIPIRLIVATLPRSGRLNRPVLNSVSSSLDNPTTLSRGNSFNTEPDLASSSGSSKIASFLKTHRRLKLKSLLTKSSSTLIARVHTLVQLSQVIRDGSFTSAKELVQYVGQSRSLNIIYSPPPPNSDARLLSSPPSLPSFPPHLDISTSSSSSSLSSLSSTAKDLLPVLFSRSSSKATLNTPLTTSLPGDKDDQYTWLLMNLGQSFAWTDFVEHKIPLSRLHFLDTFPTCLAINSRTVSIDCLDIVVGFRSGDVFWYEAIHHKYNRINKNGALHSKPVTQVAWVPGSDNLFIATHDDGTMLLLDKFRHDREISYRDPNHEGNTQTKSEPLVDEDDLSNRWVTDEFQVIRPKKGHKYNPLKLWRIGKFVHGVGKSISDVAFSSNGEYLAVTSLDGKLRVLNFIQDCILDTFQGFFGGLQCVTWTPDDKLILTGGQDDLVSVWSFQHRRLVARCRGHTSWVSQIVVDEWRCDTRNIRFASVGQDGKLLFWDFPINCITSRHYPILSPRISTVNDLISRQRAFSQVSANLLPMHSINPSPSRAKLPTPLDHHVHPSPAPMDVPIVEPVMIETISTLPLWSLAFTAEAVVVAEKRGRLLVWSRPQSNTSPPPPLSEPLLFAMPRSASPVEITHL